ncbi:MAG TPA: hypothetical protein VF021_09720 [Longimicrobiales bacterium]
MSDERFDLSALDLSKDPERFENLVGRIAWRARGELARRASRRISPVEMVAAWYRPAIAAAAMIAAVSLTLLATVGRNRNDVQTGAYMSAAEVPAAMSGWFEEGSSPTAAELLVVAHEGDR